MDWILVLNIFDNGWPHFSLQCFVPRYICSHVSTLGLHYYFVVCVNHCIMLSRVLGQSHTFSRVFLSFLSLLFFVSWQGSSVLSWSSSISEPLGSVHVPCQVYPLLVIFYQRQGTISPACLLHEPSVLARASVIQSASTIVWRLLLEVLHFYMYM